MEDINRILDQNVSRVENLISLYGVPSQGRRTVNDTDVLRAAVVLLHAGLEDYLRSVLISKIDDFSAETLDQFTFPKDGNKRRGDAKISIGQLAKFRGKKVGRVIRDVITSHLEEFQSFNDLGEVKTALQRAGIPSNVVNSHEYGPLAEMIARRHSIVHKADRNPVGEGQGNHRVRSLGKSSVLRYVAAIKALQEMVTNSLEADA